MEYNQILQYKIFLNRSILSIYGTLTDSITSVQSVAWSYSGYVIEKGKKDNEIPFNFIFGGFKNNYFVVKKWFPGLVENSSISQLRR